MSKTKTAWEELGFADTIPMDKIKASIPMIELSKYNQMVDDRNFYKEKAQTLTAENKELKNEINTAIFISSAATAFIIFSVLAMFLFLKRFKIVKREV